MAFQKKIYQSNYKTMQGTIRKNDECNIDYEEQDLQLTKTDMIKVLDEQNKQAQSQKLISSLKGKAFAEEDQKA